MTIYYLNFIMLLCSVQDFLCFVTGLCSCKIVNDEIIFASADKPKDTMSFKQCVKIISHG